VHGFSIWKKYNPQKSPVHLRDGRPTPNASILLSRLPEWMVDDVLDPFVANDRTVCPMAHDSEVPSGFHTEIVDDAWF
jgi:hypothetical protein